MRSVLPPETARYARWEGLSPHMLLRGAGAPSAPRSESVRPVEARPRSLKNPLASGRPITMSDANNTPGDMAVAGNLLVADGARLRGNLRCDGAARIGRGAHIDGDVETVGPVVVRERARVTGTITCRDEVDWDPSAQAEGLVSAGPLRAGGEPIAASVKASQGVAPLEARE